MESADLALFQKAADLWETHKTRLPYPKSKVSLGQETKRLHEHHYFYWHQMFNPRQLLALAALLRAIDEDLTNVVTPGVIFMDYVHFLIGLAENGESVMKWLEKFRGKRPQIRAALDYLARRNRNFAEPIRKIMGLMDEKTLFDK